VGMRGKHAPRRLQPVLKPRLHRYRCRVCGEWFRAQRSDAFFCGTACRKKNNRRRFLKFPTNAETSTNA